MAVALSNEDIAILLLDPKRTELLLRDPESTLTKELKTAHLKAQIACLKAIFHIRGLDLAEAKEKDYILAKMQAEEEKAKQKAEQHYILSAEHKSAPDLQNMALEELEKRLQALQSQLVSVNQQISGCYTQMAHIGQQRAQIAQQLIQHGQQAQATMQAAATAMANNLSRNVTANNPLIGPQGQVITAVSPATLTQIVESLNENALRKYQLVVQSHEKANGGPLRDEQYLDFAKQFAGLAGTLATVKAAGIVGNANGANDDIRASFAMQIDERLAPGQSGLGKIASDNMDIAKDFIADNDAKARFAAAKLAIAGHVATLAALTQDIHETKKAIDQGQEYQPSTPRRGGP
jgi:hypothetical protein